MLYYVLLLLLLPCMFSGIVLYYRKCKDYSYITFSIFISNVLMNCGCYLLNHKSIINYISFTNTFLIVYGLFSLLSCFFTYELYIWIKRHLGIHTYKKTTYLLGLLASGVFVYFYWLLGESGRQSFDMFVYNIVTPVNNEVANFNLKVFAMISFMAIMFVTFTLCFTRNGIVHKQDNKLRSEKKQKLIALSFPVVFLFISFAFPIYAFHLEDAYAYFFVESKFIEEHYVDPNTTTITWPEEKRNLVYIFLESFESTYFSKELGGMDDENLLPNLTDKMHQGTFFSNHEENLFGGGRSMPQATVTIQGMVSALGGVNYKIPAQYSDDNRYAVVPYLTTLGDLLQEQGYQQYFTLGSTVDWYHIGPFYRAHGDTITKGWEEKIAEGKLPEDYKVWWGFEDKKLFEFAREDLTALSEQDTPFYYTITTNDTHRSDGYTDPICPTNKEYPMQNAISCVDTMLSDFLDWIMEQPFYENTTIVIVGDHLAHEEVYTKSLEPKSEHRIFNLILNSNSPYGHEPQYNRDFWAADMYPTVVSALGAQIEGDQLGLGTNLFSKKPTLTESFGADYVTEQLGENSFFYTETFLRP